ncbi:MAG: hypothetical protein LBK83_15225 [Treponema sp.]|jgi:hypothetical protein|nr:hypothetical protein [Treponema sp.]
MVKAPLLVISALLIFPLALSAQSGYTETNLIPGSVDVLYRFRIDEDFYFLASEAGVYVWDEYAGPFPDRDYWDYSIRCILGNVSNTARVRPSSAYYYGDDDGAGLQAQAAREGYFVTVDIFLDGEIDVVNPHARARYTIRDSFNPFHTVENVIDESIPTEADLIAYYWISLANDLEEFIRPIIRPELLITGPPGAQITGITPNVLTIPPSGQMSLYVPMPATYDWEMTHWNYAVRKGTFFADRDRRVLTLPQQRFNHFSIDLTLLQARIPELDVSFALRSYGWFFSLGLGQQIFGLALTDDNTPLRTSFNTLFLLEPRVGLGYRFRMNEPKIPKPYLRCLVSFRLDYEKGGFDSFSPFGLSPSAGYEWEIDPHFRLFGDIGFGLYVLGQDYKKSVSKGFEDSGYAQKKMADFLYFEAPQLRFGLKIPIY